MRGADGECRDECDDCMQKMFVIVGVVCAGYGLYPRAMPTPVAASRCVAWRRLPGTSRGRSRSSSQLCSSICRRKPLGRSRSCELQVSQAAQGIGIEHHEHDFTAPVVGLAVTVVASALQKSVQWSVRAQVQARVASTSWFIFYSLPSLT
jgi:hypothetical protein